MNWLREKFSNLSILLGLLLVLIAFILLGFGLNIFGFSSDALLSLISAIVGGLIATSSQTWISVQDREHQLRLAALDKRLEAHQQAYSLWRRLMDIYWHADGYEALDPIAKECEEWWNDNCLYLDSKSREAFYKAYQNAHLLSILGEGRDDSAVQQNQREIVMAGEFLVRGVSLPTIGENERKFIKTKK